MGYPDGSPVINIELVVHSCIYAPAPLSDRLIWLDPIGQKAFPLAIEHLNTESHTVIEEIHRLMIKGQATSVTMRNILGLTSQNHRDRKKRPTPWVCLGPGLDWIPQVNVGQDSCRPVVVTRDSDISNRKTRGERTTELFTRTKVEVQSARGPLQPVIHEGALTIDVTDSREESEALRATTYRCAHLHMVTKADEVIRRWISGVIVKIRHRLWYPIPTEFCIYIVDRLPWLTALSEDLYNSA